MTVQGTLQEKMRTEWEDPIRYYLRIGDEEIFANQLIGKEVHFSFDGRIACVSCGRPVRKTYMEGYCYPCLTTLPEASDCVLRPELCRAHLGESRDMAWSQQHCLQEHLVYLADSGGLKVGVTRQSQVPTRWIDQGASLALPIARTPNRYLAGMIEMSLKAHISDKTNYRQMLMGKETAQADLPALGRTLATRLPNDLAAYATQNETAWRPPYPVIEYPTRIKSIGLDANPSIQGLVVGIRGQYLLFSSGEALNIRKHRGYEVHLAF